MPTESHHLPKVRNFTAYHVPNIMYQSKYATGKAQKAGGWIWHHKHWFGTQVEYGCRVSHALYSAQTYFQYASILPAKYIALPHLLFVELIFYLIHPLQVNVDEIIGPCSGGEVSCHHLSHAASLVARNHITIRKHLKFCCMMSNAICLLNSCLEKILWYCYLGHIPC